MNSNEAWPPRAAAPASPPTGGLLAMGSIAGVPLFVHWTWLAVVALLAWSVESSVLPAVYPEWTTGQRWAVGFMLGLIVLGSVVAREVVQAVVARRRGYPVPAVTLLLFGNAAMPAAEPRRAGDELRIAAAGPLTTLAMGLLWSGIWAAARPFNLEPVYPIAGYAALICAVLTVFNLLPGYPLDGGRLLRAAVWQSGRTIVQATRVASVAGRLTGALLAGAGVGLLVAAGSFTGIWLIIVGWFLWMSGRGAYQQTLVRTALAGVPVAALLDRDVPLVAPDLTLQEMAERYPPAAADRAFFVAPAAGGDVLGLITGADLKRTPAALWSTTSVYRAMTPRERLVTVTPDDDAIAALEIMARQRLDALAVFAGRRPAGLLTRTSIQRAVELGSIARGAIDRSAA